ncbi:TVP38/TMEM64 family protein [Staphylococcus simiae]|uniref:TVP38/TMEM64 family protein n=1 Tax=Staphylococcus simiae TaxID=308354 RepID=UPI001A96EC3D|nr:TVP38/TMEM64 family protein [Staphylococcus simiae]MBO1199503.1 TVP38/TMEM64 family protein [Staphylococcus simiae]MBO1201773.1 TVP38/TMEM64 family protein [Staphylococcus simiae]MBO1204008.1 TVP38/TMEM64 family protein [Staphylococcus simiae]MBO1211520.1 TVP38/TMEM64 family protein [Staphylococcus simiae]MBO1230247.1 TVP38/TMEM64 family protein [Staphylococcus simiae]
MTLQHLEQWFEVLKHLGYFGGFLLLFFRAVIPVFPLVLYIIVVMHEYGDFVGVIISWLALVAGSFTVYLICKTLVNSKVMIEIKRKKATKKIINIIDNQGLVPLFVLLCIPFSPTSLINIVASFSNINSKHYFIVLSTSTLIFTVILGYMGTDVTTILTDPKKSLTMIIGIVVLWIVGKKIEKHYMKPTKKLK